MVRMRVHRCDRCSVTNHQERWALWPVVGGVGSFNSGEDNPSSSGGLVEGISTANLVGRAPDRHSAWPNFLAAR